MAERSVYKSTFAEFLDELFGGTTEEMEAQYAESLGLLEDIGDAPLAEAIERLVDQEELPPESIGDSELGWRGRPDVDRVIRAGYREAMLLAQSRSVPVETLWITGCTDDFELHVCEGRRSVTVVLLIPIARDYGSERAQARSWVIRLGASSDEIDAFGLPDTGGPPIVKIQVSGPRESAS
jgi:hypothetical protein